MSSDTLGEAFDRYARPIYRFLCGFVGSREDAEDVMQNVFIKLAQRDLEKISDLRTYLWTAARNEARSLGRRPRTPYLLPRNGHAADPLEQEAVERALASLPGEQREVVLLHALEGLTFAEIASTLSISPETAASRFRYAREKLKDVL